MSKSIADKLCDHLLKTAPHLATINSPLIWGEATIPESMKKTKTKTHPQDEKSH